MKIRCKSNYSNDLYINLTDLYNREVDNLFRFQKWITLHDHDNVESESIIIEQKRILRSIDHVIHHIKFEKSFQKKIDKMMDQIHLNFKNNYIL